MHQGIFPFSSKAGTKWHRHKGFRDNPPPLLFLLDISPRFWIFPTSLSALPFSPPPLPHSSPRTRSWRTLFPKTLNDLRYALPVPSQVSCSLVKEQPHHGPYFFFLSATPHEPPPGPTNPDRTHRKPAVRRFPFSQRCLPSEWPLSISPSFIIVCQIFAPPFGCFLSWIHPFSTACIFWMSHFMPSHFFIFPLFWYGLKQSTAAVL